MRALLAIFFLLNQVNVFAGELDCSFGCRLDRLGVKWKPTGCSKPVPPAIFGATVELYNLSVRVKIVVAQVMRPIVVYRDAA
jgi:hypothetical protein